MDNGPEDKSGEAKDHWKRIVESVWTLNHIIVGLRGIMPRTNGLLQSLDELKALIPSLEERLAADLLERELQGALEEFQQIVERLERGSAEMRDLLALIEAGRARLER